METRISELIKKENQQLIYWTENIKLCQKTSKNNIGNYLNNKIYAKTNDKRTINTSRQR